ncbi:hypothetical protein [Aquimarina longa]|uniref:hypothetical protein n=1 Tax=Aquimarina longa TaxID=1080221 RepID=UPI000783282E|nr:hypothetical protein [Aquimarina longa]
MHTGSKTLIALGVVGLQEEDIYSSEFQVSAIPEYKNPIRVGSSTVDFTKDTFKTYLKRSKGNEQKINYVDSIETKPQFITLELLDRVITITELEEEYNAQAITYLKNQKEAAIVTSVSIALSKELIQEIDVAEALFLNTSGYKQYQLSLIKKGKPYKSIDFSETTIFAYTLSFFCWGENDRKQIVLADIIDEKSSCPRNTYRDVEKAKAKMNYFKL